MSYCYINIETKMKKGIIFSNLKKFTSAADEFLLYKYRNKNEKINFFFSNLKKFTNPVNEFLLQKYSEKI